MHDNAVHYRGKKKIAQIVEHYKIYQAFYIIAPERNINFQFSR